MKDTDLKIENTLPKANQTAKLHKKEYVMYIYAGKPSERYRATLGGFLSEKEMENVIDGKDIWLGTEEVKERWETRKQVRGL
jgi:cobalamin biosynthesis protein CobT